MNRRKEKGDTPILPRTGRGDACVARHHRPDDPVIRDGCRFVYRFDGGREDPPESRTDGAADAEGVGPFVAAPDAALGGVVSALPPKVDPLLGADGPAGAVSSPPFRVTRAANTAKDVSFGIALTVI